MRYLSHKTADTIMDNDYDRSPVILYGGRYPLYEEFESLMDYVTSTARVNGYRLHVRINRGSVLIKRVK